MISMKEQALELASQGLRIIPLWGIIERDGVFYDAKTNEVADKSSGKRPKLDDWVNAATTDPGVIEGWFESDPTMNYGVATGNGWVVIDCDTDEANERFLFALETMCLDEDGEPLDLQPYVVQTGRGYHYYFHGQSGNKVAAAEGLDIRGEGGQVVGPGSRSWNGSIYRHVAGAIDSAPEIPTWLLAGAEKRHERQHLGSDSPVLVKEGQRNDILFKMAATMVAHGIDKDTVRQTILHVNETQVDPPLEAWDLETSIFKTMYEKWTYGASIQALLDLAEYKWESGLYTEMDDVLASREFMLKGDMVLMPKPVWLVKDRIPSRGVMQLHGRSYTGKTFVAIDMVLSMTNGLPWLGMDFRLAANHDGEVKDHVLYILTEGLFDFHQRLQGWVKHKSGLAESLDYDKIITVAERPYDLAKAQEWDRLFQAMESDERVAQIARRIGMVVIDTQSNALVVNENDNNEMSRVASLLRRMSARMECPILLIHHDPLGDGADGGQRQTTRIGGRGAGSFGAAMDVVMALDPPARGADSLTLTWSKIKAARAPENPTMFRLLPVDLDPETQTAVCDDEGLNDILAGGSDTLLDQIAELLRTERTQRWGQIYQALGFVGTDPRVRNLRAQVDLDPRFLLERGTGRGNYFEVTLLTPEV